MRYNIEFFLYFKIYAIKFVMHINVGQQHTIYRLDKHEIKYI